MDKPIVTTKTYITQNIPILVVQPFLSDLNTYKIHRSPVKMLRGPICKNQAKYYNGEFLSMWWFSYMV